jgi:hypothetical protein
MFAHTELLAPHHVGRGTPGRFPNDHGYSSPPVHQLLDTQNSGATLAALSRRPQPAGRSFRCAKFDAQISIMLLCRHECRFSPAMLLVRKEGGIDFALTRQSHKETMVVFLRLVDPADAGCARAGVHAATRCAPRVRVWCSCASSVSHHRSNSSTRATIRFCSVFMFSGCFLDDLSLILASFMGDVRLQSTACAISVQFYRSTYAA